MWEKRVKRNKTQYSCGFHVVFAKRDERQKRASSLLYRGFPIRRCDQKGTACRLEVGDTVPIRNREKPALRSLGSLLPLLGREIPGLRKRQPIRRAPFQGLVEAVVA